MLERTWTFSKNILILTLKMFAPIENLPYFFLSFSFFNNFLQDIEN